MRAFVGNDRFRAVLGAVLDPVDVNAVIGKGIVFDERRFKILVRECLDYLVKVFRRDLFKYLVGARLRLLLR